MFSPHARLDKRCETPHRDKYTRVEPRRTSATSQQWWLYCLLGVFIVQAGHSLRRHGAGPARGAASRERNTVADGGARGV